MNDANAKSSLKNIIPVTSGRWNKSETLFHRKHIKLSDTRI